jgi:uncharacterized Zn finger protein
MAARRKKYSSKSYYGYPRYIPIAERQYLADQEIKALCAKGAKLAPVLIHGRTIANTFWGKAWCDNVESYQDYSNRLPRGRTYVRSGTVIDLQIKEGHVSAKVMGSALYSIEMDIQKLSREKWQGIKRECAGKISSLVDLISGKLSPEIMAVLCRKNDGMFPTPSEIKMTCSCPDWADLCKHLAAVLYGIGARLDTEPELFFLLRGVDQKELLSADVVEAAVTGATTDVIGDSALKDIFNIDLDGLDGLDEFDGQQTPPNSSDSTKASTVALSTAAPEAPATPATPAKRGPGRPKKNSAASPDAMAAKAPAAPAKRGPGRPKKNSAASPGETAAKAPAKATKAPATTAKAPATAAKVPATPAKRGPGRPKKNSAASPGETAAKTPAKAAKAPATAAKAPATAAKAPATAAKAPATAAKAPTTPAKRGPGRPKKNSAASPGETAAKAPAKAAKPPTAAAKVPSTSPAKRGPGRPKKSADGAASVKRGPGRPYKA